MGSVAIVAKLSGAGTDVAMTIRVLCGPAQIVLWNYPVFGRRWSGSSGWEAVSRVVVEGRKVIVCKSLWWWVVKKVGIPRFCWGDKKGLRGIE
jgi:hypothetical protein